MLYKVEARNVQGELLTLEFADVSDGIIVEDILGLDPVKATIASSKNAKQAGAQLQNKTRDTRNLILKLELEPDYITQTVEDVRDRLYDFFMPESDVALRLFRESGLTVDISGTVEDFISPQFVAEPKASITIHCMDPDFVDVTPVEVAGDSTSTTTETLLVYPGNVKTGFVFVLNIDRTLTEFTIYHRPPDNVMRSMDVVAEFEAGDILTISTVENDKYVKLNRGGTETFIAYAVSPQATWHQLTKGDNNIRVYAEGAAIPYTLTYIARYGGL
jgi:hypothetical protein